MKVIHLLRKPLGKGTVASNTLKHGVGGLNIDASRIAHDEPIKEMKAQAEGDRLYNQSGRYEATTELKPSGRWPANLILQHLDGCRCKGTKEVKGVTGGTGNHHGSVYGARSNIGVKVVDYADEDGKETIANWICAEGCPVEALDDQSGILKSGAMDSIAKADQYTTYGKMYERRVTNPASEGGASRFFKQVGGSKG